MLFCITADYTPTALTAMREKQPANRAEAMATLCEAAGGKLVAFYGTIANGPGAMAIIEVDPGVAPSIAGVIIASGAVTNVQMKRLFTMDETKGFREKAKELSRAYRPPGQ